MSLKNIAILDLRDAHIQCRADMVAMIDGASEELVTLYDNTVIGFVVLHEDQEKWLRFEMVDRGEKTALQAKKLRVSNCQGLEVVVVDRWDGLICSGCRRFHDDDVIQ